MRAPRCRRALEGVSRRGITILRTVEAMRVYQAQAHSWRDVGFVPTMGALHAGHVSLVTEALRQHNTVVASIFVNPTQFGAGEDLDKYPRTLDADIQMLAAAGVSCVFAPDSREMYGEETPLCHVEPRAFGDTCEGLARPDFFRGVATVVTKLFNIVQPTTAFFGQKDVAQCVLVQRLVQDLNMAVRIHVCETMRDADGLAKSSRNAYLNDGERRVAGILYKALSAAKLLCEQQPSQLGASISRLDVIAAAERTLRQEPLVGNIEYVSVASPRHMRELDTVSREEGAVISAAVRLGSVRLIDNVLVGRAAIDILTN